MPILYIPNDPEASGSPAPRRIAPRPKRTAGKTDFDLGTLPPLSVWPQGSDEFLVWQCREGLLRSLAAWEKIAGPFAHWQGGPQRKKLRVDVDAGEDINAYYDRASLGFYRFESSRTGLLRRFAASTDIVAHEAGHAFLDALRPALWDSNFPEPNAFHEAFGDCLSILTALADATLRRALLDADPNLSRANFAETLMESLANAIADEAPDHNAAKPRKGKNSYRWALPTTLPEDGGPGELINEVHSFGQVFVGCFYDTLRNIFRQSTSRDSSALRKAAETAGKLLVRAAEKAAHTPRFFQSVGRAMTLEDEVLHQGRHHTAIRDAFGAHGILLGSNAAIAPRSALRGKAPARRARAGKAAKGVARETLDDLKGRMHLSASTQLSVRTYELGGRPVAEVCHLRAVPLDGLSERLRHVVAYGTEPMLVGGSNRRAAVLGALPDPRTTEDEVRAYVAGLVDRDAIAYGGRKAPAAKGARRGAVANAAPSRVPTHAVVRERGKLVLKRIRYACGCCAR